MLKKLVKLGLLLFILCGIIVINQPKTVVAATTATSKSSDGWEQDPKKPGVKKYRKNGKYVSGFQTIGKYTYYFDNKTYIMQTGWLKLTGTSIPYTRKFYFDSNGHMKTGWQKISDKWYYFATKNSKYQYYPESDNSTKKFYTIKYKDKNGKSQDMLFKTGELVINYSLLNTNTTYSYTLLWINEESKTYCTKLKSGELVTDIYIKNTQNKKTYVMALADINGALRSNRWFKCNNKWYYLNGLLTCDGKLKINGDLYYFDKNYHYMCTGWIQDNYSSYYAFSSGKLAIGWQTINGKKYYFNKDGMVSMMFTKIGNYTYYFAPVSGELLTNRFITYNKYTYYVDNQGRIAKGFKTINGIKYHFDEENGKAIAGFFTRGKNTYYSLNNGKLKVSTTMSYKGKTYKFDKNGVCTNY